MAETRGGAPSGRDRYVVWAGRSVALVAMLALAAGVAAEGAGDPPPPTDPPPDPPPPLVEIDLEREPAYHPEQGMGGRVRVLDPLTGEVTRDVLSPFAPPSGRPNDLFGFAATIVGDVDGDGVADFAAAAPRAYDLASGQTLGRVTLHCGVTGDVLLTLTGDPGETFGVALAAAPPDHALGDPGATIVGVARLPADDWLVYSGLADPAPGDPEPSHIPDLEAWRSFSLDDGAMLAEGLGVPPELDGGVGVASQAQRVRVWPPGDLNADGVVNTLDLLLVGEGLDGSQGVVADVQADGVVDMGDAEAVIDAMGDAGSGEADAGAEEDSGGADGGEEAEPVIWRDLTCPYVDGKPVCPFECHGPNCETDDTEDPSQPLDEDDQSSGNGGPGNGPDDDNDGIPNVEDCDSEHYQGDVETDCACQDDDGDGIKNQNDCDSSCANCAAYSIAGAKYIGVNGETTLTLGPCEAEQLEWTVVCGEDLSDEIRIEPEGVYIKAERDPGEIVIRAEFIVDGQPCELSHTVNVVEYDDIEIIYSTFIPCEVVPGPPDWLEPLTPPFYGGNNRTFDKDSNEYKTRHHIEVNVASYVHVEPPDSLPNRSLPFGVTRSYPGSSVAATIGPDCPFFLVGPPLASATLARTFDNHRATITQGTGPGGLKLPNQVSVHLYARGANPLLALAPPIIVDTEIELEHLIDPDTGEQTIRGSWAAKATQYPAHEFYIEGEVMWQYDPIPMGGVPSWLAHRPLLDPSLPIPSITTSGPKR